MLSVEADIVIVDGQLVHHPWAIVLAYLRLCAALIEVIERELTQIAHREFTAHLALSGFMCERFRYDSYECFVRKFHTT
jgi:hypothetical protein